MSPPSRCRLTRNLLRRGLEDRQSDSWFDPRWLNQPISSTIQLYRLLPVIVKLFQLDLGVLEGLRRFLHLAAHAIEVRRREGDFELLQARLLRGDLRLQVLDLAIGILALPLRRLAGGT